MAEPKYPDVEVELSGQDGNAAGMIARTAKALRRAGADDSEIAEFRAEATSGGYSDVLAAVSKWVEVS